MANVNAKEHYASNDWLFNRGLAAQAATPWSSGQPLWIWHHHFLAMGERCWYVFEAQPKIHVPEAYLGLLKWNYHQSSVKKIWLGNLDIQYLPWPNHFNWSRASSASARRRSSRRKMFGTMTGAWGGKVKWTWRISVGCLITLASWTLFSLCHRVCSTISLKEKKIFCKRGIIGKYGRILWRTFFFPSTCLHLDVPQWG